MSNVELQEIYSLSSIVKKNNLYNTKYIEDILCIGHEEKQHKSYSAQLKIRNFLENLDVDGRIILNSIFKKAVGHCGVDSCCRQGSAVCSCEISGLSD
jgi:hypothetical protein